MIPVPTKVLLVSDDRETANVWCYALQQAGFEPTVIPPVEKGDTERRPEPIHDLIMVDAHASYHHERAYLVKRLREDSVAPILVLMYNLDENLMLLAYDAGADEVMPGSISVKLLLAKLKAWQRRSGMIPSSMVDSPKVGSMRLDLRVRQLIKDSGETIRLTGLESRLMQLLMSHPDKPMSSSMLAGRIWGIDGEGDTAQLKTLVYRLRRKIEPDPGNPRYIQAISGEGYIFMSQ